jgi:hypothetical protein
MSSTTQELAAASQLIEKLILAGAHDFTRAALRTSFLASCVSACRSRTMTLADTVTVMAQRLLLLFTLCLYMSDFAPNVDRNNTLYCECICRLRERLQECNGDEVLKAEAAAKVQRFTEWALKCIGSHSRGQVPQSGATCDMTTSLIHSSAIEPRLQLRAFKKFLELAGFRLTKKDYTEAFDAACFPLTLFSSAIDPGWATGMAASAMQGLLDLLVEGGADNVNQCFLEAARFGSTELVRILLQVLYTLHLILSDCSLENIHSQSHFSCPFLLLESSGLPLWRHNLVWPLYIMKLLKETMERQSSQLCCAIDS